MSVGKAHEFFRAYLTDTAGGTEKSNREYARFYWIPLDSMKMEAIKKTVLKYNLSEREIADFNRLKAILTNADSLNSYGIVYKKKIGQLMLNELE